MTLKRRLSALAIGCAIATTGVSPGLAQASTTTAATTNGTSTSFVVATLNVRHGLSDSEAVADVAKLAGTGADIVSLQEMGSRKRRDAVRAQVVDCETCPYNTYMPTGAGPAEIPILYRSTMFTLVSKGLRQVSPRTYVGPRGAGPSWIAPKYLTYVQLRHKPTGQAVYVINNHAVASVQARDGGPNHRNGARLKLYRKHMNGLKAMVSEFKATGAAVVATGDFNVNYRRDSVLKSDLFPYHTMQQVGMSASFRVLGMPARGTHVLKNGNDSRLIDYVAAVDHVALAPQTQQVLLGYNTDHRPVSVRYAVAAVPDRPEEVTAEPLERSAKVTWTRAPDNGHPVASYTVTNVQTRAELTVPGHVTSATVTGLSPGASYTFSVRAANRLGSGPASEQSNPVTPFVVPPQTAITSGPRDGAFLTRSRATFGFSSDQPGSTFQCFMDGDDRACSGSSVRLTSLTQATHTFAVTARDGDGDIDPTPALRSFTVPLDSTALGHSRGWTRGTESGYYASSYIESSRHGALLRRDVSDVSALALVATTGPGQGTVQVYLGKILLQEIDLERDVTRKRRVLPVARFESPASGRVRVVVSSSDRPVRVEGLGVATR